MSFGLQIVTSNGDLVIDEFYNNYGLLSTHRITSDTTITIDSLDYIPIVALEPDVGVQVRNLGPDSSSPPYTSVTVATNGGTNVYVFADQRDLVRIKPEDYGLSVYNTNGDVIFSSIAKMMKYGQIIDIPDRSSTYSDVSYSHNSFIKPLYVFGGPVGFGAADAGNGVCSYMFSELFRKDSSTQFTLTYNNIGCPLPPGIYDNNRFPMQIFVIEGG